MAKTGKGMLKFAILVIALISQINTIASVMMTDIALAFPDASDTAVQYVMQCGMIGAFVVSFLLTFLTSKFKKKTLVITGIILIILGGLVPIVKHDTLVILYAGALLVGAGQGIILPTLGALILESFEGDERNRMLGLNTAFYNAAAAGLLVVAGIVCATGWVNVYFLYFVAVPVLIIAILFLNPEEKKAEAPAEGEAAAPQEKAGVPVLGWIQCLLNVLLMIGYASFPLNVSLYVVRDAAIGDAAGVGVAMSLVTIVAALVSLILPQIIKLSKLYIGALSSFFGLLATVLVVIAKDMTMIYVAAIADGIFFGILMAGAGYLVGRICTPAQYGPTYALSTSFVSLGTIFCPIVLNLLANMWGGDVTFSGTAFYTAIGIFAVALVLQIAWGTYLTKVLPPEEA